MAFDEIEMPAELAFGFRGGVRNPVSTSELSDGHILRQARWAGPLREFVFEMSDRPRASVEALRAFWLARGGGARGFRFKDFTDFEAEDEAFGTGDGATTAFQLIKTYAVSGEISPHVRTIKKPVSSGLVVKADGTPMGSGWSVNTTTGVVTFSVAPALDVALTWSGEFRVPVIFLGDQFDAEFVTEDVYASGSMTVRELRR